MTDSATLAYQAVVLYADFTDTDSRMPAVDFAQRRQLAGYVDVHGGRLVEAQSHKLQAVFLRADGAIAAARDMLVYLGTVRHGPPLRPGLQARMLLGYGAVRIDGERIHSDWGFRLAGLVSQVPQNALAVMPEVLPLLPRGEAGRPLPAREGQAGITLQQLMSADDAASGQETRLAPAVMSSAGVVYMHVRLRVRGASRDYAPADCPLLIGRDPSCTVQLRSETASRVHGRIIYAQAKFWYADESKNGSWVLTAAGDEMHVRGERLALHGSGAISPGVPISQQTGEIVRFECLTSRLAMAGAAAAPALGDETRRL